MEKEAREFRYHMSRVHLATWFIFDYCGVRVADIREVTMADWQKVLDCRHGDERLEELFARLESARADKAAAYAALEQAMKV
jgi:hypothetical protein